MSEKSFVFSWLSILSPIVLMLLIVMGSATYIFIFPLMFWMLVGWIIGLCMGIAGLVFSIMTKKEFGKFSNSLGISILGIILNLIWLSGVIYAFPAWMSV